MVLAQVPTNFIWPIDSPRTITGNYGELRPNHFHAGLDFSTKGEMNVQVYAIEEGFVSRIRVSSVGYGKSVYITHPNGKVSVYAHLNSFSLKINQYAKKEQLGAQSFEIDFFPKPKTVSIRKNEIIGLSGNSGGSTGPHLHFEIRDEKTETPLNPLEFFSLKDNVAPTVQEIAFYDLSDTCAPKFIKSHKIKQRDQDTFVLESTHFVLNHSILGIAFSGSDRFNTGGNPNNIYSVKLLLNDQLIYSHKLTHIDFADNRYINEFSELIQKNKFQKCFLPSYFPTGIYGETVNKGRVILTDSSFHKMLLIVEDESGNEKKIQFYVKAKKQSTFKTPSIKSDNYAICTKDFNYGKNNLRVHIPANTLYYSTPLIIQNTIESSGKLIILPSDVNLANNISIGFKIPKIYEHYKTKLILKSNTSVFSPTLRQDSAFFSIKHFGWLQLSYDTIPPKIKTQIKKVDKLISFLISDQLSGIAKYNVFVNDKWVIAEYDAKSDLLTYFFDEETPDGNLSVKVDAEDKVGNKAFLNYELNRP